MERMVQEGLPSLINLSIFPFHQLTTVKGTDYENIRKLIEILKRIVVQQEFYRNANDCFTFTMEFILGCCSTFVKNSNSDLILYEILILLELICNSVNTHKPSFTMDNGRVIHVLDTIIDTYKESYIKIQVGRIVNSLIYYVDELESAMQLICKCCNVLEEEGNLFELVQIFNACFSRKNILNDNFILEITKWTETHAMVHLQQVNDSALIHELLISLNMYYEINNQSCHPDASNMLSNKLQGLLQNLCYFMGDPALREQSEILLTALLYDLHYNKPVFSWHDRKEIILMELKQLPLNLNEWFTTVNVGVLFSIAYLQLTYSSECMWKKEIIWTGINRYCSDNVLQEYAVIKCLLFLYPLTTFDNPALEKNGVGLNLISVVECCKFVSELLTYHPIQIVWLLRNGSVSFKMRVLVSWLKAQPNDEFVRDVLESSQMGSILILFLVKFPTASMAGRVSNMIGKFHNDNQLNKAIELSLPFFCEYPAIFSGLIQIKPQIPDDPVEVVSLIHVIAISITSLTDSEAIHSACNYCLVLIDALERKCKYSWFSIFCDYTNSIKFLIAASGSDDDKSAFVAINLLEKIIRNQIHINSRTPFSYFMNFATILKGGTSRIIAALALLSLILKNEHRGLLVSIPKETLPEIYDTIQSFLNENILVEIFYVLRLLVIREPSLVFLLSTPLSLKLMCNKNLNTVAAWYFLKFLNTWLEHVEVNWESYVPVKQLWRFLTRIPRRQGVFIQVLNRLSSFGRTFA